MQNTKIIMKMKNMKKSQENAENLSVQIINIALVFF